MKAVIQRVKWASVQAGNRRAAIGPGLLVLAGLERGDTEDVCEWAAAKIAGLRVFEDAEGKMNLGLSDMDGEILVISQFTLAGSIARGRRPSFDDAMRPEEARILFERFAARLQAHHSRTQVGFFQEAMAVELLNDGPVTFILER
ncbi:MAG: D-aminoacyl-tRNA deacylase [Firmicutes bacterium]|nr:D-aminoacyl-tRNA deacylase [Bacillota bacterium]